MSLLGDVTGLWHCIPCFCCPSLSPKTWFSKGTIQKKLHRVCVWLLLAGIGKFLPSRSAEDTTFSSFKNDRGNADHADCSSDEGSAVIPVSVSPLLPYFSL